MLFHFKSTVLVCRPKTIKTCHCSNTFWLCGTLERLFLLILHHNVLQKCFPDHHLSALVLSEIRVAVCLTRPSLDEILSVLVFLSLSGLLAVLCLCSVLLEVWEDHREGEWYACQRQNPGLGNSCKMPHVFSSNSLPVSFFMSLVSFPRHIGEECTYRSSAANQKTFDSWQANGEFNLAYLSFVWGMFCPQNTPRPMEFFLILHVGTTILTGEDTFTLKNAYLIVGAKPCYAGKSKSHS